jgi:uncharacterized protein (TIGR04255 family)
MANSAQPALPDYDVPPVIEVVCGVQFAPLKGFQATAFGLLWQRFKADYPTCEQQEQLAQVVERLGEPIEEEQRIKWTNVLPLPRMFFIHKTPCWLVQVQSDRFLHNWRKVHDTDKYPHFPEVQKRFWSAWERLLEFCREERIETPQINQLEVTYINHIFQGEGWDGLETIGRVFPDISWRAKRSFLPSPESVVWQSSFLLPNQVGRLHVSLRHAIRRQDMKPVLLCELTARGIPNTVDEKAIREWFLLGREWIVRGFADLADDRVQKDVWKKKKV